MADRILVRLAAELTIKSRRTRSVFLRRLVRNLGDALRGADVEHRIETDWGRIYVHADARRALPVLTRVFGISSVSTVERTVPAELAEIVAAGEALYRTTVADRRFAVRARRVGQHPFHSKDVEVELGAALLPHAAGVDLSDPDVTIHVEVRDQNAFLFSERVAGPGGLPLGVEGNAVALLSGGYDSAVAAWLMLRRGIELDYVFCNLGGDAYERAVVHVAKLLADEWSFGSRPHLHALDFGPVLDELRARVRPAYWQVVLKRLMYRAALQVAAQRGAEAIITGEAVGQVSSQTLTNLRAIDRIAELPVFRPLLGFEKGEIIERARDIGTAALSEQVREYCAIAPGRPVTAASVAAVDEQEARLDLGVIDVAVAQRKVIDLRALQPTDLVAPYLFAEAIPHGAVVIDCRPRTQYRSWHLKGAEHREEWEILKEFRRLDRDRVYILYCAHGIQTAYIAERMQRAGFEAYSFRGGLRGIMKYAQEQGLNVQLLK
ncbi:MAG TPA: tRNA uracil 4-sulfurtransferase ThiI [Longimicrobiales bacterium]|nr:tRNA uracil 4-sulfurtransferase ThiI [Longimicrobiales bacterium]